MTLSVIPDALVQRVTAHLEQFGTLARPVLWTGKGSVVAHFTTDLQVVSMDTRFEPLTVNWTQTFRSPDGAIYLNVPAAWRKADREAGEGEANTMPMYLSLSEPQQKAIRAIDSGDQFANVPQGTLKALFEDGWVVGTKEGGRILPPLHLTPAGETMIYEYDVMRLNKAVTFAVGQAVQYLKWNANNGRVAFEWMDATVTSVGKEMISLDYADGSTGTRRAVSLRQKPDAKPIKEMLGVFHDFDDLVHIRLRPFDGSYCGRDMAGLSHAGVPTCAACIQLWQNDLKAVAQYVEKQRPAELASPYAWATPERHAEVQPISEKLLPLVLRPTKEDGVWLIEDATTEKTMRRGLNKFGVTVLSVEEGESVDEDTEGEPYTIARFSLGKAIDTPFPSKRQTKPAADPNSIHAQYDALHGALPVATQLLIQANGDEWLAFQMDAMLLRRYAPLCRFSPQTVNQAGEQWDKLSIPAGLLDETVTNANEGGLTVALASIVRDEPGKLPVREVDEIHAPNEPVQYVGKEEPPTEWETEADADDEPLVEVAPIVAPMTPAPSEIEMTPALMAAKIKLRIHGGLRLGLIESVTPMPHDGWFAVTFVHGLTEAFTVPALKMAYEVGDVWRSKRTVYVREQSTAPHGTAIEQAAAVLENLSAIGEVFADAKARMEAFTEPEAEPATVLLDHDAGADLIATLRTEHADLSEAALGITEFLLNVIARMRMTATVAAPF